VPFVEANAAEARLAQRHERAIVDQAAEVSGLAVTHDLARVADRLEIAGDDLVERRPFRAGDLYDAVAAMGWNRPGETLTIFPFVASWAMPGRNSRNWVERMMVKGTPEASISFSWATLARK